MKDEQERKVGRSPSRFRDTAPGQHHLNYVLHFMTFDVNLWKSFFEVLRVKD